MDKLSNEKLADQLERFMNCTLGTELQVSVKEAVKRLFEFRWQPIETASKDDGIKILCASIGNSDVYDGNFTKVIEDSTLQVNWVCSGMWSNEYNRFYDGIGISGFNNLTHWMPMPLIK